MSSARSFGVSTGESDSNLSGDGGQEAIASHPRAGALYLAGQEVRKTRRAHLVAVAAALGLGVAAAYMFDALPTSLSEGSPVALALNTVFMLCIAVLPRSGAWPSEERGTGRGLSSEGHIAFLKTLPLTYSQIVAARALVAVFGVLVLFPLFLGSFYAFSENLRDGVGVGGVFLFASFWIGCSLAFEAIGLFTEMCLRGRVGFYAYLVMILLLFGTLGYLGENGIDVVSWAIELTQSLGAASTLAVLLLGVVSLALSWLVTVWRLNQRDAGS